MTQHLLGIFVFVALFSSAVSRADDKSGTAAQLKREVSLRKEPSAGAPSAGRLPKGTILTLQGQEKNGFVAVDVELEDGSVEGWIPRDALNQIPDEDEDGKKKKKKGGSDDDDGDDDEPVAIRRPRKVVIPKDEGVLLRRDPLFFYGLQAGGGVSYLTDDKGGTYLGPNFGGGGHIGMYLDRTITVRLELAYDQLNGSSSGTSSATGATTTTTTTTASRSYQYAFVNIEASLGYWIEAFELSAGGRYSYGISLTDLPTGGTIGGASDLSNVGIVGGVGYKFSLGEVTDLVLRAKGSYSFLTAPLNFITGGLYVFFSFRG